MLLRSPAPAIAAPPLQAFRPGVPTDAGAVAGWTPAGASDPWSPRHSVASGDVLFYTGKPGAWRMMLVNIAGGALRPFLDDGTSKSSADWCPAA